MAPQVPRTPELDVVDTTWLAVRPGALAAAVGEPANWRRWWPQFELTVDERRGMKGVRWTVGSAYRERLTGSMEIYLEPADGGVVAYYFLRLGDRAAPRLTRRRRERLVHDSRSRAKHVLWDTAAALDPSRLARVAAPRAPATGTA